LERDVALKLLAAGRTSDDTSRQRFLREARSASALNHPNIVNIHEIGEGAGLDYISMELVEVSNVAELLKRGQLSLAEALSIAVQTADALAAAHRSGLIHRDIKSAKHYGDAGGHVKLLDFGLAKRACSIPSPIQP
jgi:eukaryotic-like serine/threonine-protein kinase